MRVVERDIESISRKLVLGSASLAAINQVRDRLRVAITSVFVARADDARHFAKDIQSIADELTAATQAGLIIAESVSLIPNFDNSLRDGFCLTVRRLHISGDYKRVILDYFYIKNVLRELKYIIEQAALAKARAVAWIDDTAALILNQAKTDPVEILEALSATNRVKVYLRNRQSVGTSVAYLDWTMETVSGSFRIRKNKLRLSNNVLGVDTGNIPESIVIGMKGLSFGRVISHPLLPSAAEVVDAKIVRWRLKVKLNIDKSAVPIETPWARAITRHRRARMGYFSYDEKKEDEWDDW